MKKLLLIAGSLFLAGCTTHVLLVHSKTGERITCRGNAGHPALDSMQASDCANQYEALGFIRAENLTPAQKERISKPTATRVEQEITIKQTPVK